VTNRSSRVLLAKAGVPLGLYCALTLLNQTQMTAFAYRFFPSDQHKTFLGIFGVTTLVVHCAALVPGATLVLGGLRMVGAVGGWPMCWTRVLLLIGESHAPLAAWSLVIFLLTTETVSSIDTPSRFFHLMQISQSTRPAAHVVAGFWLASRVREEFGTSLWRAVVAVFLPLVVAVIMLNEVIGLGVRFGASR